MHDTTIATATQLLDKILRIKMRQSTPTSILPASLYSQFPIPRYRLRVIINVECRLCICVACGRVWKIQRMKRYEKGEYVDEMPTNMNYD